MIFFLLDDGEVEYEHKDTPSIASFKSFSDSKKDQSVS